MSNFVVLGRDTVVLLSPAHGSPSILAVGADIIVVKAPTQWLAKNPTLRRFSLSRSGFILLRRGDTLLPGRVRRHQKKQTTRRALRSRVRRPITTTSLPPHAASLSSVSFTQTELRAAARAVIRLFRRWGVQDRDALRILRPLPRATYQRWKHDEVDAVDHELGFRLSTLISIHTGLRLFFKEPSRGYRWVKVPNVAFNGQRPLDLMMTGDRRLLFRLRAYLHDHYAGH